MTRPSAELFLLPSSKAVTSCSSYELVPWNAPCWLPAKKPVETVK